MSKPPFGFGPPQDPDEPEGSDHGEPVLPGFGGADPTNPFAALFGAGGGPADLGAALQQIGRMLSYEGGPVNWQLAKDTARQTVAAAGDRSVSDAERRAVQESVRLAQVWLDGVTTMPAGTTSAVAWSRAEWVEGTLPAWQLLIEPVAVKVAETAGSAIPEDMRAMAGPMMGMMQQLTGAMFGGQVGQGIGQLAGEVATGTDIGLPLGPAGTAILVPQNVEALGEGLEVPPDEVLLYLALREAAHQRLFAHVPWLAGTLRNAVADYAAGIQVDSGRLEELVRGIDPSDPSALQSALSEGLLTPEDTPAQQAALARLETLLALVEGWVDAVVTAAAATLPSAARLREAMRRRRASGGPAEQTFATLVGLELRPRRLREAAALWEELAGVRGVEGRDAVWDHPDLLPSADDLDDPAAFVAGSTTNDFDLSALEILPPTEDADDAGDGPGDSEPDSSA